MFPTVVREEVTEQARLNVNGTTCGFGLHFQLSFSSSLAIRIFTCYLCFICVLHLQLKVQPATGGAPWLQGGELPHPRPPCSAAQRACSGGDFGKFGNFGNFGKAYMVFSDL